MSLDVHPLLEQLAKARSGAASMNITTMTFVVFVQDPKIAGWVRERAQLVANKHPSRVVFFDGTTGMETHADSSSARGEWVDVGVHDSDPNELSAALAQLALPEAPIMLAWISADIADDMRFATLAEMADAVIVSTSLTRTDRSSLLDLVTFIDNYPQIAVQDIAYLRLGAWQEIVAEFFDEPELLAELTEVREVEIAAGSEPEMYYMLGWLASRLAWTPDSKNMFTTSKDGVVKFALVNDGPPRRMTRVVLKSPTTSFTAEIHAADDAAVCLRIEGVKARYERCAPLHTVDIASLVERAILATGRDEVFIETLTMAKHIMERQPE